MRLLLLALVLGVAVALVAAGQTQNREKVPAKERWRLCGTEKCKQCSDEECASTNNDGLDRDKNKEDLKSCPDGFHDWGYKHYDQMWPVADVYLRVCEED